MYTTAKPPPPIPELYWCATPAANAVAIAASTALPPRPRISRPAAAAGPTDVTTMPRLPHAGPGSAARASGESSAAKKRAQTRIHAARDEVRIAADRITHSRARASVRGRASRAFRIAVLAIACVTLLGCGPDAPAPAREIAVVSVRGYGEIRFALLADKAPRHVANFKSLAASRFYDGTTFHRVIPNFMIQGGDPNSKDADPRNDGYGGPGYFVKDEFNDVPHRPGVVSMGRGADPDTAGSQFFIMTTGSEKWRPELDGQFSAFGELVVRPGRGRPRSPKAPRNAADRPVENVRIESVRIESR